MFGKLIKKIIIYSVLLSFSVIGLFMAAGFRSIDDVKHAVDNYQKKANQRALSAGSFDQAPKSNRPTMKQRHQKALDHYRKTMHP